MQVEYVERPGLFWLSIKNFLLGLVTLTIYRFWGKTAVRRHVWSSIRINGEPLEYTGTGKELFLGALIIFLLLILPLITLVTTLQIMLGEDHWATLLTQFVLVFIGFLLWGMAIYRARRYRLSRTLWRGIRGTLTGSSWSFSLLYFGAMLLRSMTLGWSTPAMNLNIQKRLIGEMEFGSTPFRFGGVAGPLYSRYALCWFGAPLLIAIIVAGMLVMTNFDPDTLKTLAKADTETTKSRLDMVHFLTPLVTIAAIFIIYSLVWTLYTAREMSLFAEYTCFDAASFKLDATPGSLIGLWLGNLLIMIFTLGIGQPFVVQRMVRYMANRLSVEGTVDVATIQQSTQALDKRGEGLLEAFDVDAF